MRRRLLAGAAVALLALPATGHAQSGGATVPAPTGGAGYGTSAPGLTASRFEVTPRTLMPGAPASFRYRIDGAQRSARVRIELLAGRRRAARPRRIRMGWKRTRPHAHPHLDAARGRAGARRLRRPPARRRPQRPHAAPHRDRLRPLAPHRDRAAAPPPAIVPAAPVATGTGVFPVRGAFTWGDAFGVKRGTTIHRGQDILTAEGTPIATPRARRRVVARLPGAGAGNYVVVHADDGRDFVFMHLQNGSVTVTKGAVAQRRPGVRARPASTGHATGPHLHFEIWPDGWYASDASQPIDPRPDLRAWATAAG